MLLKNLVQLSALSVAIAAPVLSINQYPTVQTQNGSIQGLYIQEYDQDAFLGIPYAEPPLGQLRFVPPQPFTQVWNGTKAFDQYGKACIAGGATDNTHLPQSEDCLTLNIVRPKGYENQNLPIGLWIHGGGFRDGSSSRPAYNLSFIVQNGVDIGKPFIGVSINYRLSGLGFLAGQEVANKGWTNVGLRDQIKAIQWVHENIEKFGGNPDHIVIWGESAGAISVSKLLSSGKLGDYIKGAIIESGPALFPNLSTVGSGYRDDDYGILSKYFNCSEAVDSLKCLQSVDIKELFHVFNVTNGILDTGFRYPYIDGEIIPKASYSILSQNESMEVPILIGTSTDEGSAFVSSNINTTEELKAFIHKALPSLTNSSVNTLESLYPLNDPSVACPLDPTFNSTPVTYPSSYGAQYPRLATLYGDLVFFGGSRIMSKFYSKHSPVYKYRFNIPDLATYNKTYFGTTHFQEVVYVFDNDQAPTDDTLGATWNPNSNSPIISESISKMWANFITDLSPNVETKLPFDAPNWPEYGNGQENMVFDLNGFYVEKDDQRAEQIDFIESIMSQLNA